MKATSFLGGYPSARTAFETGVRAPLAVKGQTAVGTSIAKAGTAQPAPSSFFSKAGNLGFGVLAAAGAAMLGRRRRERRSSSVVVRHAFPSQWVNNKFKVLRRLEPYGAVPGWTHKKPTNRHGVKPWKKRRPAKPSEYGRTLIEKQRLKFHYNVQETQLRNRFAKIAFEPGHEYPVDRLMQMLESRLDNVVYRVGAARSVPEARYLVSRGYIETKRPDKDWVINITPSFMIPLNAGVRVRKEAESQAAVRETMEATAQPQLPSHLEWDREEMTGKVLDLCDRHEFGIEINPRLVFRFWSGQNGLPRKSFHYYPGTQKKIPWVTKHEIKPTPENILNMKLGIGLKVQTRNRPPCLWGRKYPVNNIMLPDPRKMTW